MSTATITPPRFCKDCLYFREERARSFLSADQHAIPVEHWCYRRPPTTSLVTGDTIATRMNCHEERTAGSGCSTGGFFWTPLPTYEEPPPGGP